MKLALAAFKLKYMRFLVVLLLSSSHMLYSQNATTDSLEALLHTSMGAGKRIDILNQLAYAYFDRNDSIALVYAHRALEEATREQYSKGKKYALTMVGLGYVSKGDYDRGFQYFRKSAATEANQSDEISAYNFSLMGNAYRDLGVYDSSMQYYNCALSQLGTQASPFELAPIYKNMAFVNLILWHNEEALVQLKEAERLAQQAGDEYTLRNVWNLYSSVYENLLDFNKAEEYNERMCSSALSNGDNFHIIRCHLGRANLAYHRGNFQQSLQISFVALELTKTYRYPPQMAALYQQIGDIYAEYSQYDLAFKYYFESLKITEKLKLNYETAAVYSALAWLYKDQQNFELSLEYLNKSQTIRESIGDQRGVANCHNGRGLVYLLQGKYPESIAEQEKGLRIRESIVHVEGISASLFNLSLVYKEIGQFEKAESLQKQAIRIEEKIDNKQSLGISYNSLADLSIKTGNLEQAEDYVSRAFSLAQMTQAKRSLRNVYNTFSLLYEAKGDFKKALEFEKKYRQLNDSILQRSESSETG